MWKASVMFSGCLATFKCSVMFTGFSHLIVPTSPVWEPENSLTASFAARTQSHITILYQADSPPLDFNSEMSNQREKAYCGIRLAGEGQQRGPGVESSAGRGECLACVLHLWWGCSVESSSFNSTTAGGSSVLLIRLVLEHDLGHYSWKFGIKPSSLNLPIILWATHYPLMNLFSA